MCIRDSRRIEALTGRAACELIHNDRITLKRLSDDLKISRDKVHERVKALVEEVKSLRKQLNQFQASQGSTNAERILTEAETIAGITFVHKNIPGLDVKQLRDVYDGLKSRKPEGLVVVLATSDDSRATIIAGATKDAVQRGVNCGNILRSIAPLIEGNGGGKPEMAQAGGKWIEAMDTALDQFRTLLLEILNG